MSMEKSNQRITLNMETSQSLCISLMDLATEVINACSLIFINILQIFRVIEGMSKRKTVFVFSCHTKKENITPSSSMSSRSRSTLHTNLITSTSTKLYTCCKCSGEKPNNREHKC